jgi:hypothetical protein
MDDDMTKTNTPAPVTPVEPAPVEQPAPPEEAVDFMAEAPAERPYDEAVTDAHREHLAEHGIRVGGDNAVAKPYIGHQE